MAQDYRPASLGSSDSGQALPFWARSRSQGPPLGRSDPGSPLSAHGPRLGARLRPWLHATNFPTLPPRARVKHYLFEPVANPTAPGSGVPTPARVGRAFEPRPTARGSGRGSGHGSMLPISLPYLLGLGSSTTFLSPWPIPRLPARAFLPQLGWAGRSSLGPRPAARGEAPAMAPCYQFPYLTSSGSGQALPF